MSFPVLPATVPHLKEDGSNWATFATRFRKAMQAIQRWGYFDGTIMCPVPKDNAHPTTAERQAIKEWEHGNGPARGLLTTRLADTTLLCICGHKTAKARWDALIKKFGHPGNPNDNTPEGVAHPEPDSTPGEDANPNTDARVHLEGAGSQLSMDGKEGHSLEVEEEGIAGENASVEGDIGPRVELQDPGVSPLATQEDVGSLTPPSSPPSPTTPEAASTQRSPAANMGTSATPEPASDNAAEETFRAKTSGAEDEDALDRAGLEGRLVKEEEEWDADEETGAVTTMLVEDAPCIESRPIPHNVLHAPAHSHTLAAPGAPDEEEGCLRIVSPRGEPITNRLGWTLLERVRAMGHAIWLPKPPPRGCNVRAHDPDGSKPDTCAREGRRLSSDIDAQAHPTVEQDAQAAPAAQLEGEESRRPAKSEQTAAPETPSTFF